MKGFGHARRFNADPTSKTAQKTATAPLRFQPSRPDRRPDESAHRRLRLGSRSSPKAVWISLSDQKSFSRGGQRCLEANRVHHLSLVSLCGPYRVRRTTDARRHARDGAIAHGLGSQAPLGRHSVCNSRRSRGGDAFDRAVDCGVGMGTCRPNSKGFRSAQRDRHRAGDKLAAAFSVN